MPFAKGNPGGPGRPKGKPNQTTAVVKAAIAKALEGSAPMVTQWLKDVGEADPFKGIQSYASLAEFVTPKQARTEVSGPEGEPLQINVVTLARPAKE